MMTERQALALEERFGGSRVGSRLEWLEVTAWGQAERTFILNTPRCRYCGQPTPDAQCRSCGASALRDGE